ncbi:hypothetical protein KR084_007881, partial [Drosophila pseudotakahashii]
ARLQFMQAEALPYQPGTLVVQPPKRLPPEAENDRRMYIPNLNQEITHRDVFNYFCSFGDLERVCVRNGTNNLNYAMVLFSQTASMDQAIKFNPHLIKGNRLNCRKANERIRKEQPLDALKANNQRIETCKKPRRKTTVKEGPKTPVWVPKEVESRKTDHQKKKTILKRSIRRSVRLQKLLDPKSKKTVTPAKADRNYVYAVMGFSRWSFKLSKSSLSLDEERAFEKGPPRAAQILLSVRGKEIAKSSKFLQSRPETPGDTKPDGLKSPGVSCVSAPLFDPLQPPVSISNDCSLALPLTRTPLVPLPKTVIPEISKKDLRSKVLSTLGQNYKHHCYTNVEAYQKNKCYIDLPPDELIRRPSVQEYVDQMYADNY